MTKVLALDHIGQLRRGENEEIVFEPLIDIHIKDGMTVITTTQAEAYAEARVRESQQWQPIETAPKTGRTVLLGFVNSHGNWRTMLGRWISNEEILNEWEDGDLFDEGWYEISVEADDAPNCWLTNPSHWMPLPPPPVE